MAADIARVPPTVIIAITTADIIEKEVTIVAAGISTSTTCLTKSAYMSPASGDANGITNRLNAVCTRNIASGHMKLIHSSK